nr:immunoglobulin heavy chain junction region [Homo sapiens]
CARVGGLGW